MEGKTNGHFDGIFRKLKEPKIQRKVRRFGVLGIAFFMLIALIGNSAFPQTILGEAGSASATRLWSSGAELNSTTANMEVTGTSGTMSVDGTTKRSGDYAYRTNPTSSTGTFYKTWANSAQTNKFWFRQYIRIATAPGANTYIMQIGNGGSGKISVRLTSSSTLQLRNEEDNTNIGSASSALSTNTWYRVEVFIDTTTISSTDAELLLDGVSVSSSTSENLASGVDRWTWGVANSTTADIYFDDLAVNDSTARSANNWPGEGKIVHMHPNATGSNSAWTNTYTAIDEVTPNDGTDSIYTQTNNAIEDVNLESSSSAGIGANDKIKLVSVGVRVELCGEGGGPSCIPGFGGDINYAARLTAGGSTDETQVGIDNTNPEIWYTNDDDSAKLNAVTAYDLPGSSTAPWTPSDLDSTEVGVKNYDSGGTYGFEASAIWLQVEYVDLSGGRIFSSGYELNSDTASMEWTSETGSGGVQGTTKRTGGYAFESATNGAQSFLQYHFNSANDDGTYFVRTYFRIGTGNGGNLSILELRDSSSTRRAYVTLTASETLQLYDEDGQIGSASSTLSTATWYRLEVKFDRNGGTNGTVEAKIDGAAAFATSSTRSISTGVARLAVGNNINADIALSGQVQHDDVAINKNIGTNQNTYPGEGNIIHLRPNADDGTNTAWTNGWANVDEVTPDDATTLVSETTADDIDDYDLDASPIGAGDDVNLVSVGVRFRTSSATQEDFRVRLKDASGGTAIESDTLSPASTTWVTNSTAEPRNYPLTAYTRPESDVAWTDTELDTAQVGLRDVLSGSGTVQVSAIWLLVDYSTGTSITVSGNVYTDEGTTAYNCSTDNLTIKVSVNGGSATSGTCTASSGAYSVATGSAPSAAGDPVVVYIESSETPNATSATLAADTTSAISINLYQNRLITRHENSGPMTNAKLSTGDNGDAGILYSVSAGNLTVDAGNELHVWTGDTFTPGGNVTTSIGTDPSGDVHIDTSATLSAGTNTLTVGGGWDNDGTFTAGTSTVLFNSTNDETLSGTMTGSSAFNNFQINDNSLVSYWRLDDATGTSATDSSGNTHTGTLTNFPGSPWNTSEFPNYSGYNPGALDFDGTNDYIDVASPELPTGDFTYSAWIKPDTVNDEAIFMASNGTGSNEFILYIGGSAQLQWTVDGNPFNTGSTVLTAGEWVHVAFVRSGSSATVYVDDVSQGTQSDGDALDFSTCQLLIGTDTDGTCASALGNYFNGEMDDLRIYDRALSAGELTSLASGNHPDGSTFTLAAAMDVDGNVDITTGTLDVSASNYAVTVSGNYKNISNFNDRAGTVTFDAGATGKTIQSDPSFYDITFNNASGGWNVDNQVLESDNKLTLTAGTLSANSNCYNSSVCSIYIEKDWDNNGGTYTHANGTVYFHGETTAGTIKSGGDDFYNLEINNESLVGYWKLDEGTGSTARDDSGYGNDGTMNNFPADPWETPNSTDDYGHNQNGLTFDAANDYINVPDSPSLGSIDDKLTLAAWVRRDTDSTSQWRRIVSRSHTSCAAPFNDFALITNDPSANNTFELNISGTQRVIASSVSGTVNTWYHLAGTYDGTTMRIYVDGVERGTGSWAGTIGDTNTPVNIGRLEACGNYADGGIDDVRIYNRQLSAGEITSLAGGNHPGATGVYTLQDALSVANDITVRTGKLDVSATNYGISLKGNYTNVADFDDRAGTTTLNGTASGKTIQADKEFYNLTLNGTGGVWAADNQILDAANDITITNGTLTTNTTCDNSTACPIYLGGSWTNNATYTANSGLVRFDSTDTGETISGTLNGTSSFYKVDFNGTGGGWTTQNPMIITATDTDSLNVSAGTATIGNSDADDLEVRGGITIANTANETGTLQTASVAEGSTITLQVNESTSTTCGGSDCVIKVGADSGSGQGNLRIAKNGILQLTPNSTSADVYVDVRSTGYFEALGGQDDSGTSNSTTNETTLTDTTKTWTGSEHVGKTMRMTSGSAKGKLYPITANTATALTRADTSSATFTASSLSDTSSVTKKICASSATIITASRDNTNRFIYDSTGSTGYYRVVYSTNNDSGCSSNDSFEVIADPDSLTNLAASDTIEFSDGIEQGDAYEILDFASVTAESGTSCNDTIAQSKEAYVTGEPGAEMLFRYAEICSLGRNISNGYGISVDSDGDNANEGFTLDKSYVYNNYYAVVMENGSNNSTISDTRIDSSTSGSVNRGIYGTTSTNNTISNNRISGSGHADGSSYPVYLESSSDGNTISGNYIYQGGGRVFQLNGLALRNTISNNYFYEGANVYLNNGPANNVLDGNVFYNLRYNALTLITNATNNMVKNNTFYANEGGTNAPTIDVASGSINNYFYNNNLYRNLNDGIQTDSTISSAVFQNNTIDESVNFGIDIVGSGDIKLIGNTITNNDLDAVAVGGSSAINLEGVANTFSNNAGYDVGVFGTSVHNVAFYNTAFSSTNEVNTGVTTAGVYIISKQHDSTNGATRIWGEYTIPDADSITPQAEETDKFNYTDNLWEDSFFNHDFNGNGTEDTDLDYAISGSFGGDNSEYVYRAVCTAADCVVTSSSWDVYRNGTLLTAKASTGTLYTDTQNDGGSAPNVQFKIDDVGTNYGIDAVFTFVAFKASADTNTQKTIDVMQDGDKVTVGTGETIEMKGQSSGSNETTVTRGASGGYHIDITGTIDAQYYSVSYLGGTGGANGLDLQSGATVTNIADGTFNNFQNVGASDTYLKIFGDLITTGSPSKTFANVTFTEASDNVPEYSVTVTGGTPSTGDYWLFDTTATCTGWTSCEDSDSDTGDGAGSPNENGYARFATANTAPDSPTSLVQKRVTAGTTMAVGDWTNETQVLFEATATDTDNPDTLQLCVETDILGTGFSNTEDLCGSGVAYSGSGVTVTVTITGLTDASEYHWQARVKDAGGLYSSWVSYGGNAESARDHGIDTTACTYGSSIYDGTTEDVDASYNDGSLTSLSANWDAFTCTISGLDKYEYSIGTTVGGTDIKTWTDNSTTESVTASSLVLKTNEKYYVNVRATDNAANVSSVYSSDGQDVLPEISMSLGSLTITFADLTPSNDRSDTKTLVTTTSTNGYGGYVIRQYAAGLLTSGSNTIPMFSAGTYASPAAWPGGACSGATCGYGYTSDDTTIQGSNLFSNGTLYAPFSTTAFGDIVADHTDAVDGSTGKVVNEQFTITHKVAVDDLQEALSYSGTVYMIATGTF